MVWYESHLTFSSAISYADIVANRRPSFPASSLSSPSPQFSSSFHMDPSQNPSTPYYLHPNENPNLVLVSPVLTGLNYHSWSHSMKMALQAKNKYVFVTGELPMPAESESLCSAWIQCNTIVVSWLTRSVSPDIARSILWLESAAEIWSNLKTRFSQGDAKKISELQDAISQLTQQTSSVSDYYINLRQLWDQLYNFRTISHCKCTTACCNCCASLKKIKICQEQDFAIKFLKGLNPEFSVIRSQILLMEPLPSLASIFSLVVQQEKQLNVSIDNQSLVESNVFFAQSVKSGSNSSNPNKRGYFCTYCDKSGHTVGRCFRKYGIPPGFDLVKKNQSGSSSVNANCTTAARIINSAEGGKVLSDEQFQMLFSLLKPSHSTSISSDSLPTHQHVTDQLATIPKQSLISIFGLSPGVTVLLCGMAIALLGSFCYAPTAMLPNFVTAPIELSFMVPLHFGESITGGPHFSLTSNDLKKVLTGPPSDEVLLSTGHASMGWFFVAPLVLAALYVIFLLCFKVLVLKFSSTHGKPH